MSMDQTFLEEQHYLKKSIKHIQKHIENNPIPHPEVTAYSLNDDTSDRNELMIKKSANDRVEKELQHYRDVLPELYFARLDLSEFNDESVTDSIYIGKQHVEIGDDTLVHDWRSPIGQSYYIKSQTVFKYNKYSYTLRLRRALSVSYNTLLSYQDEYVYGQKNSQQSEKEVQVSDPFLIELIKEKHNQGRLTDIIRTIQQNQNNIIQLDPKTNFIVQGCAGSGKTMILLHRLSYLKYNYPNMDLNRVCIITPNENFNLHINDLAAELELDRIERYSVEEYYLHLLSQYDKRSWKKRRIKADSKYGSSFLSELYSLDFKKQCEDHFIEFINKFFETIRLDEVIHTCERLNFSVPIMQNSLKSNLAHFASVFKQNLTKNKVNKEKLKKLQQKLSVVLSNRSKSDPNSPAVKLIKNYHDTQEPYHVTFLERLQKIDHRLFDLMKNIIEAEANILKPKEEAHFIDSFSFLSELTPSECYTRTIKLQLQQLENKHHCKGTTQGTFHFTLYLRLLFYKLFSGGVTRPDSYLHIDESQDFSPAELLLFKEVLRNTPVFNLYGDTHQLINGKGISDWNQLSWISNQYQLNENYRNTNEITNYCNEIFQLDITPIGVPGEPVHHITTEEALEQVRQLIESAGDNDTGNYAVVVKSIKTDFAKRCIHLGCIPGKESPNSIPIFTIEQVKGLEFDKIIVYDDKMCGNERYISYTRALATLYLVSD